MSSEDDHTETIFIAPHAITLEDAEALKDNYMECVEKGRPMILGSEWRVISGPPWDINPPDPRPLLPPERETRGPWLLFWTIVVTATAFAGGWFAALQ